MASERIINRQISEFRRRLRAEQEAQYQRFREEYRERRKVKQARRDALRNASRFEVWLALDSLLRLYEALLLDPVFGSPTGDGLPVCQWYGHTRLPRELYERRLQEFEAAGGCKEAVHLFRRLDAMKWRPEPWLKQLCAALFGKEWDNESNAGRETIWQTK